MYISEIPVIEERKAEKIPWLPIRYKEKDVPFLLQLARVSEWSRYAIVPGLPDASCMYDLL